LAAAAAGAARPPPAAKCRLWLTDRAAAALRRAGVWGRCAQDGCTPLHCAACNGHASVVALLLERRADVEAKNNVRPLTLSQRT
jgi:hypothetical protein